MVKCFVTTIALFLFVSMETIGSTAPLSFPHPPVSASNHLIEPASPYFVLVKKKKLNFLNRFLYKIMEKKIRKAMKRSQDINPDKLARQANLFGWLAIASIFIFPLAAIPLGILAITQSTTAMRNGTSLAQKAKTGRTLGIIALALFVVALTVVLVTLAGLSFL